MLEEIKISAVIITFNEERKIEHCLRSLLEVADEIVVVDSNSTDETEEICKRYPVRFIKHEFEGYVDQKNYAMRQASYDHVLSLDADERLSEELKRTILKIKQNWGNCHGYAFNRFNNYCGQWIRFCGWYPDRKIRLWDRRLAQWGGTDPHDKVIMDKKYVRKVDGDILHYSYLTVDEHVLQMYKFGECAAKAKFKKGHKASIAQIIFSPGFRFIKNYFFQLGFLDGYYGFIYCAVSSTQSFFKYLRLVEYNRNGLPKAQKVPFVLKKFFNEDYRQVSNFK